MITMVEERWHFENVNISKDVTKMSHPWIRTRMAHYVIVSFLGATATF